MPHLKYLFSILFAAVLYTALGHTAGAGEEEPIFHPPHHLNLKFSPPDAVTKLGVQCLTTEGDHAEAMATRVNNGFFLNFRGEKYVAAQGGLGSCTSHACQYAVLGVHSDFLLSRLGLYKAALDVEGSRRDSGVSLYSDFLVLTGQAAPYGYFPEHLWPYDDSKGWNPKFLQNPPLPAQKEAARHQVIGDTGLAWVGPDLYRIRVALANGYFLPFGMQLHDSFMRTDRGGRVPSVWGRPAGGHAMCFIGYDDLFTNKDGTAGALIFRNSWGEEWGKKGDGFLPYNQLNDVIEVWAVRGVTGQGEAAAAPKFGVKLRPSTEDDLITHPETKE